MSSAIFRRALLAPTLRRPFLPANSLELALRVRHVSSVAEVSFWKSLVPKPLRSRSSTGPGKQTKAQRGWNPATFFIFIFLLIGSMSIQMISLRKDFVTFMRQSDVRIGLLREVVEKLQRGEKVDVEKVLGTGDAEKELEWEDVLKEIEREEAMKTPTPRKKQSEPTPTPTPSPKAENLPATDTARPPVQSELATRGFF